MRFAYNKKVADRPLLYGALVYGERTAVNRLECGSTGFVCGQVSRILMFAV